MGEDLKYWVWLSQQTDVSLNAIAELLSCFGTAKESFLSEPGSFYKIEGISRREAETLERRDLSEAEKAILRCEKENIKILSLEDEDYPQRLKEIYAPPVVLYIKGTLPDLDGTAPIAVIGTRTPSDYGRKMGRSIAYELAECGAVVVSGLTRGVDAAGAEGALDAGGTVVGVLGTPVDEAGSRLARRVAGHGALISEYAPGTAIQRSFFRARNRIAAGISCGVVVAEAPEKSGTRLFVAEALEQGKEIYAIPSNADSETGAGSLRLLREGARLVLHGWHIAEDFPGVLDAGIHEEYPGKKITEPAERLHSAHRLSASAKAEEKNFIDNTSAPCYIEISEIESLLSSEQRAIVEYVNGNTRQTDEIIEAVSLPASVVLGELTVLEIMGIIKRRPGGEIEMVG